MKNDYYNDLMNLKVNVSGVKDGDNTTVTKTNGKYIFDPNNNSFTIDLQLSKVMSGLEYSYFYNIQKLDEQGNELVNVVGDDMVERVGDILSIPLDASSIEIDNYSFNIQIYAMDPSGIQVFLESEELFFESVNKKNVNVALRYKNSNEAISKKDGKYVLYSNYYDEENPLLVDIDLTHYNEDKTARLIFRECSWNNDEEVCTEEKIKNIELSYNSTTTIEVGDFVPVLYSGEEKRYEMVVDIDGELFRYNYIYSKGNVYSIVMSSNPNNMYIASTIGDSHNYFYKGYSNQIDNDGYVYILYKGDHLSNIDYKYKIKTKVTKNGVSEDKTLSEGTVNGTILMNNTFVVKLKDTKGTYNLVDFYLYDEDDNLNILL